jgi:hypothetical protein
VTAEQLKQVEAVLVACEWSGARRVGGCETCDGWEENFCPLCDNEKGDNEKYGERHLKDCPLALALATVRSEIASLEPEPICDHDAGRCVYEATP